MGSKSVLRWCCAWAVAGGFLAWGVGCAAQTERGSAAVGDGGSSSTNNVITASAAAAPDLDALQAQFQSVAARVSPAVVAISAATTPDDAPSAGRQQALNPDALNAFLSTTTRMVGAGFFISSDGYILTNDHVIDDAQQLWVTTDNKMVYPALVVGSDPRSDLAILKIPATHCPTVALAPCGEVRRGQWSIAIGNPFGLGADGGMCLSVGVISATDRSLPKLSEKEDRSYYNMVQTTAQINPGSSGGPLLDLHGNLIGINTAVVMPAKFVNGIGFAIPITPTLMATVEKLRRGDAIDYAYLGVATATATQAERATAGLNGSIGAKVMRVYPDSPAAGELREDDVIITIGGEAVAGSEAFTRIIGEQPLDRPVTIEFVRRGDQHSVSLELRKRGLPADPVTRASERLRWAGMVVGNRADGGGVVVCAIEPSSEFARAGLHEGSVITSVAGRTVGDVISLQRVINDCAVAPGDFGGAAGASGVGEDSTASLDR